MVRWPTRTMGVAVLAIACGCSVRNVQITPVLPPHPIKDHPATFEGECMRMMEDAMAPLIAAARAELAAVRARFDRGLKAGEKLYLTVRIPLPDGSFEQPFVELERWDTDGIAGTLASDLVALQEPTVGGSLVFGEDVVVDWTVVGPEDREEGNRLGHWVEAHGPCK
jgi:hypothetical protein